jgi:hypothetical protein
MQHYDTMYQAKKNQAKGNSNQHYDQCETISLQFGVLLYDSERSMQTVKDLNLNPLNKIVEAAS